jgi:acetyl esterase
VKDIDIPGPAGPIPARVYSPDIPTPAPVLVYYHGGGWVLGDLEGGDPVCRSLANQAQCMVVSVDYRLAPEAKFPAAVEDCYAAAAWVSTNAAELGVDPGRIAVGGDSAGGNLAAVISQMARDLNGPKLIFQLLVYPATDMRMTARSIDENAAGPILTKASMVWFIDHYLRDEADKTHPQASPLLVSDLTGLPSAFVLTAECDPLRDEGEAYARSLQQAGIPVEVERYPGMPHGFFSFGAALDTAKRAIADAARHLRKAFSIEGRSAESGQS